MNGEKLTPQEISKIEIRELAPEKPEKIEEDFKRRMGIENIEGKELNYKDKIFVKGFDKAMEVNISNEVVLNNFIGCFGKELIRNLGHDKIKIQKANNFIIEPPLEYIEEPRKIDELHKIVKRFKDLRRISANILATSNKITYEKVEAILEGKERDQIKHICKRRATGGRINGQLFLVIYNFDPEAKNIDQFDYLKELNIDDEKKRKIYLLSTIAHEFAHELEALTTKENTETPSQYLDISQEEIIRIMDEYATIVDSEFSSKREKFVSDYVLGRERAGNIKSSLYGDDFTETLRIYFSNANYLNKNYPKRYAFIKKYFPLFNENFILKNVGG